MSNHEALMQSGEYIAKGEQLIHASEVTWGDLGDVNTYVPPGFRHNLLPARVLRERDEAPRRILGLLSPAGPLRRIARWFRRRGEQFL